MFKVGLEKDGVDVIGVALGREGWSVWPKVKLFDTFVEVDDGVNVAKLLMD
jgi:hypothetical protein